jgi:flagellar basal-body rod modification protein FlgD
MTPISLLSKTTATTPTDLAKSAAQLTGSSQTLNQNDFLQLLVKQIQFQDPLNPKSNTDMAAQMAQFTSLQQASQMSSSLSMLQANSLVGSTVVVQADPTSNAVATGVVSGVTMDNGTPQIIINGLAYKLSQLLSVMPTAPLTSPSTKP